MRNKKRNFAMRKQALTAAGAQASLDEQIKAKAEAQAKEEALIKAEAEAKAEAKAEDDNE